MERAYGGGKQNLLLKRGAAVLLVFCFVFSPLLASAEVVQDTTNQTPSEVKVPTESQEKTYDLRDYLPVSTGDEQEAVPVSNQNGTQKKEGETSDIGEGQQKGIDEPEAQMQSGTSPTRAGSLFVNNETTHSAAPEVDTQTGALQYTYSISSPPGRKGASPNLALIYNSNSNENTSPT